MKRNSEWLDSMTLYQADIKKMPENARLHFALANEMLIASRDKTPDEIGPAANEAIGILKEAINIYPRYSDAYRAMGNGYFLLSRADSAKWCLERAVSLNEADMDAWFNLNVVSFALGHYTEALNACSKVIGKNPLNAEVRNDIALCYLHLGKPDSAVYHLDKAIAAAPDYGQSYANLALAYKMKNNVDSARKYETIAGRYIPGFRVY